MKSKIFLIGLLILSIESCEKKSKEIECKTCSKEVLTNIYMNGQLQDSSFWEVNEDGKIMGVRTSRPSWKLNCKYKVNYFKNYGTLTIENSPLNISNFKFFYDGNKLLRFQNDEDYPNFFRTTTLNYNSNNKITKITDSLFDMTTGTKKLHELGRYFFYYNANNQLSNASVWIYDRTTGLPTIQTDTISEIEYYTASNFIENNKVKLSNHWMLPIQVNGFDGLFSQSFLWHQYIVPSINGKLIWAYKNKVNKTVNNSFIFNEKTKTASLKTDFGFAGSEVIHVFFKYF